MGSFSFFTRVVSRLREDDRGFTLVELMIALGVILVAMLSLAYTATIAFTDTALARQRQAANALANQTIEQIRALPLDTLANGLGNADLASGGDTSITVAGSPPNQVYSYGGEEIPRGSQVSPLPLVPHRSSVTVGPTTYTRSSYLTYYQNLKGTATYRLTVVVTWPNPARRGVSAQVQVQTVMHAVGGCAAGAAHPFAAPCQPFLYGSASNDIGGMSVAGVLSGISFNQLAVYLAEESSDMQIEQIASVQGAAQTSGIGLAIAGQAEQVAGRSVISSAADNDPAHPGHDYESQTSPAQGSSSFSAGVGVTITVTEGVSSAATTKSTTAATSPRACADKNGAVQTDSQPCGSTTAQSAAATASLGLSSGIINLGVVNLFSIGAAGTPGVAFTDRVTSASDDGRLKAQETRTVGDTQIAGLPSLLSPLLVPLGWQGYLIRVQGLTDTVTTEAGVGTGAPSVTSAGTISLWNGLGYTSVPISPGNPTNLSVTPVHISSLLGISLLTLDISASVKTGGTSTAQTVKTCSPTPCPNTRTRATATAASPLLGTVHYSVVLAGVTLADVTVTIDLGTSLAKASYGEAPGG